MKRFVHALALSTVAFTAGALDTSVWTGLKVTAESLAGEMRVNGVPVRAIRFTGRDVMELEQRWLSMRPPLRVRTVALDAWRVHAALNATTSEVLQVRGGDQPELIWSLLRLSVEQPRPHRPPTLLPSDCQEGRTVEGPRGADHFIQYSALCKGAPAALVRILGGRLQRRGFSVLEGSSRGIEAASTNSRISISFLPPGSGGSPGTLVAVLERALPQIRP